MNIEDFSAFAKGEVVAGCIVATVDGKRQYVYQAGEVTRHGHKLFQDWQDSITVAAPKRKAYAPREKT